MLNQPNSGYTLKPDEVEIRKLRIYLENSAQSSFKIISLMSDSNMSISDSIYLKNKEFAYLPNIDLKKCHYAYTAILQQYPGFTLDDIKKPEIAHHLKLCLMASDTADLKKLSLKDTQRMLNIMEAINKEKAKVALEWASVKEKTAQSSFVISGFTPGRSSGVLNAMGTVLDYMQDDSLPKKGLSAADLDRINPQFLPELLPELMVHHKLNKSALQRVMGLNNAKIEELKTQVSKGHKQSETELNALQKQQNALEQKSQQLDKQSEFIQAQVKKIAEQSQSFKQTYDETTADLQQEMTALKLDLTQLPQEIAQELSGQLHTLLKENAQEIKAEITTMADYLKAEKAQKLQEQEYQAKLGVLRGLTELGAGVACLTGSPKAGRIIANVGGASINIYDAITKIGATTAATTTFAAALPYVGIAVSVVSLISSFLMDDDDDGLAEALQAIMEGIQQLSRQVEEFRQEMHKRFDRLEAILDIFYIDVMREFGQLHLTTQLNFKQVADKLHDIHVELKKRHKEVMNALSDIANRQITNQQELLDVLAKYNNQTFQYKLAKTLGFAKLVKLDEAGFSEGFNKLSIMADALARDQSVTTVSCDNSSQIAVNFKNKANSVGYGFLINTLRAIAKDQFSDFIPKHHWKYLEQELVNPGIWLLSTQGLLDFINRHWQNQPLHSLENEHVERIQKLLNNGVQVQGFIKALREPKIIACLITQFQMAQLNLQEVIKNFIREKETEFNKAAKSHLSKEISDKHLLTLQKDTSIELGNYPLQDIEDYVKQNINYIDAQNSVQINKVGDWSHWFWCSFRGGNGKGHHRAANINAQRNNYTQAFREAINSSAKNTALSWQNHFKHHILKSNTTDSLQSNYKKYQFSKLAHITQSKQQLILQAKNKVSNFESAFDNISLTLQEPFIKVIEPAPNNPLRVLLSVPTTLNSLLPDSVLLAEQLGFGYIAYEYSLDNYIAPTVLKVKIWLKPYNSSEPSIPISQEISYKLDELVLNLQLQRTIIDDSAEDIKKNYLTNSYSETTKQNFYTLEENLLYLWEGGYFAKRSDLAILQNAGTTIIYDDYCGRCRNYGVEPVYIKVCGPFRLEYPIAKDHKGLKDLPAPISKIDDQHKTKLNTVVTKWILNRRIKLADMLIIEASNPSSALGKAVTELDAKFYQLKAFLAMLFSGQASYLNSLLRET